jgi:SSS family solute:Na+ symporter
VREDNGAIIHEITVVPRAAEAGKGLVPAETDSMTDPMEGTPRTNAKGQTQLNYEMAMPEAMGHFLPIGLLGLALTALIACLLGGVAASVTAFNTVFTYDIYQAHVRKDASDAHYLAVGRWAAVVYIALAAGAGCAAIRFNNLLEALAVLFAVINAPLLATVLLGIFWKRATGHGAFAGLVAGLAAAIAHLGLTLPDGEQRGWDGGWMAVTHRYPSALTRSFWTAAIAFGANLIVTVAVSLCTQAKTEEELCGLVHGLTKTQTKPPIWWMQPERLAVVVLVAAVVVCLLVA